MRSAVERLLASNVYQCQVAGFKPKVYISDHIFQMDSDEADFQPGPSFHTAVKKEMKVNFKPPLKKNRK